LKTKPVKRREAKTRKVGGMDEGLLDAMANSILGNPIDENTLG